MNATLAQTSPVPAGPVLPAIPALYAIARVLELFSGNSSVPHTAELLETIATISYDEAAGVLTLTDEHTSTVLSRVYAASYECHASACLLFVEGWITTLEGKATTNRWGLPTDIWGRVIITLDPDTCQADPEWQRARARHQG